VNALTLEAESFLRLGTFLAIFIVLAIFETIVPRRTLHYPKSRRWMTNLSIGVINTALARLLLPFAGAAAAIWADDHDFGLLNNVSFPGWLELIVFLLVFDLTIYSQHRLFHAVKPLWRLHRMHHTDPDYDVTTGNRFHPVSILLSGLIKTAAILLMGPAVVAVVAAEILLNLTSMFNHSNIRIPEQLDRWLRLIMVTPDMHRVHHSVDNDEHNHNFGFNFPWWDRLLGTYQDKPAAGHENMSIGIEGFQNDSSIQLLRLLTQPAMK